MTNPTDTENPLARSRLEDAQIWIKELYESGKAGWDYDSYKTVEAALEHLLNPTVTDEMVESWKVARQLPSYPAENAAIAYIGMIAELTKEDA